MATVTRIIPAINKKYAPVTEGITKAKRVAAYARVSTDNDEQLSSYEAQIDYYTKYIKANPAWKFSGVYSDEGISATTTKKREGFNRMITDALNGKIDFIITKSVSRFARNTVDTLTTIRKLKENGVEVYFEKENIYTMDSKGELLITIISSLAQEESRSISANVTWGQRKRFADGKVSLPYGQFLGYEKGKDGLPKIIEKEAEVVRLIYRLFLEGKTAFCIAKHLTDAKIPTPGGKKAWHQSTIKSILTNEKYKGDAILQKSFTVDFLTKKKKINEGEIPQYYVENSHPAIVTPEVFELVQQEFIRRKKSGRHTSALNCFASRIVCGDCGGFYGRKVWHSNTKYATTIWQCNNKFQKRKFCSTPHLKEETVKKAFIDAFNSLIENKKEIINNYERIIDKITDFRKQEEECGKINKESGMLEKELDKLVTENARTSMDQNDYNKKYNEYAAKYNNLQKRQHEINNDIARSKAKKNQMILFIKELKNQEQLLTSFDESLWCSLLNAMIVKSDKDVVFQFKDGTELPWVLDKGIKYRK